MNNRSVSSIGKRLARRLIDSLDEQIDESGLPKLKLYERAGVSRNKLSRAVERGNVDLAGFVDLIVAAGLDPLAFINAYGRLEE